MRTPPRSAVLLAAALAFAACETTVREVPPPAPIAHPVVEIERFDVVAGDGVVGTLKHFELRDPQQPLRFWRVENGRGAWVGHASEALRFSRRVPFEEREQDLGIWPLQRGVAHLLEVDGPVQLRPARTGAAEASAPREAK